MAVAAKRRFLVHSVLAIFDIGEIETSSVYHAREGRQRLELAALELVLARDPRVERAQHHLGTAASLNGVVAPGNDVAVPLLPKTLQFDI